MSGSPLFDAEGKMVGILSSASISGDKSYFATVDGIRTLAAVQEAQLKLCQ